MKRKLQRSSAQRGELDASTLGHISLSKLFHCSMYAMNMVLSLYILLDYQVMTLYILLDYQVMALYILLDYQVMALYILLDYQVMAI